MQVICIVGYPNLLTVGKIYEASRIDNGHTYITDDSGRSAGWLNYRFKPLTQPPDGWVYCRCGTITKNKITKNKITKNNLLCCDCR